MPKGKWSGPISRVLSRASIYLGRRLPGASCGQPGANAASGRHRRPRSAAADAAGRPLFGLAPGGVWPAGVLPHRWCALTAPFHPCPASPKRCRAVCFCATFRRVAPPGCYPAPCPMELGLSSPACAGADAWPTPLPLYHTTGPTVSRPLPPWNASAAPSLPRRVRPAQNPPAAHPTDTLSRPLVQALTDRRCATTILHAGRRGDCAALP